MFFKFWSFPYIGLEKKGGRILFSSSAECQFWCPPLPSPITNYGPSLDRPVPMPKLVFTECRFLVPTSAKLCISNYGPSLDRPVPVSKLVFTECQFWCPPLPSPISSYHSWVQQKLSPLNILLSINSHVTFFQI